MSQRSTAKTEEANEGILPVLGLAESTVIDFKRAGGVSSTVRTAVAMANTDGGFIFMGIEDPAKAEGVDRLYGLEEKPESVGEIQRALVQNVAPSMQEPDCCPSFVNLKCRLRDGTDGTVLLIVIPKSNFVHSVVNGGTYARFGPQNRQLSAREITELSLRRGVQSAVNAPADVAFELLDTQWWHEYAEQRSLTRELPEAMRHLGLAVSDDSGTWRPTMAAVLLFAEHPGGLLQTKAAIRVFHHKGHQVEHGANTSLARRPITIDGPVLAQIQKATKAVLNELNSGVQVSSDGFEFTQRFPIRVVQEAITNAVIHRDYRLSQDIHIRIFANRIEVESPGGFPGAVTPENVREIGSKPRNRAIVDHLREFPKPPNLDAGEGVKMMFEVMEQDGLYPPAYDELVEQGREYVQVTLKNEARLPAWALVEDYLAEHGTIRNADVRRILNLGDNTVKASKLLREWRENDLVEVSNPEVGNRNREYRLKRKRRKGFLSNVIEGLLFEEKGMQNVPVDKSFLELLALSHDVGHHPLADCLPDARKTNE